MTEDKTNRIPELDGIRGLAILMVVIYHYGYLTIDAKTSVIGAYFRLFLKYFYTSIDLFFMLSGFLIGGILIANKGKKNYFKAFYLRRACRILPLYFFSILLVYTICSFGIGAGTDWWFDKNVPVYSYFLFIQNFFIVFHETFGNRFLAITWSLAIEEQFYLILPLLICLLNRKWMIVVLSIGILSAPFLRQNTNNYLESFLMVYCRFDSLFTGVLLAIAVKNEAFLNFCRLHRQKLWNLLFLLLAITLLFLFRIMKLGVYNSHIWFLLIWFVLMVVVVTNKDNFFSNCLRSKLFLISGKYSFGIYIYHQIVIGMLFLLFRGKIPKIEDVNDLFVMMISLVITFAISYLSFHYFERKFIAFGHRFKY